MNWSGPTERPLLFYLNVTTEIAGGGELLMASNRPVDIECVKPLAIVVPFAPSRLCMPEIVQFIDSNIQMRFWNSFEHSLGGWNVLTILTDSLNLINCFSTSSCVEPSTMNTSIKSSVSNWHEYPIFTAVSAGTKRMFFDLKRPAKSFLKTEIHTLLITGEYPNFDACHL